MSYLSEYILSTRYLRNSETSFNDIADRVSEAIATNDSERKIFNDILKRKLFVPGGRTIACAGTDKALIPNCVVLPVNDSLDGIFDTLKRAAILQQSGSGLGFDFSDLRPAGYNCHRTGGGASGPISFLNLYAHAFKIVQQYNRSGANIALLSIDHPDVVSFIHMKDDLTKLTNFNISIMLTERFWNQLRDAPNTQWKCVNKWDTTTDTTEMNPRLISYDSDMVVTDVSELEITVKELFDEIVEAAWRTGEPGLLLTDNVNECNNLKNYLGPIHGVNPCGEITLYPNECCNLGSINLEEFVKCDVGDDVNDDPECPQSLEVVKEYIDDELLRYVTNCATVFMNNVIDKLAIPDIELKLFVLVLRRLGLGIMGLADMLIRLRIPYDSPLARDVTEYVLGIINEASHDTSQKLSVKYGSVADRLMEPSKWIHSSNAYELSLLHNISEMVINRSELVNDQTLTKFANCACTCIAPTGSTSMIHNVSSGIEPYFALAFKRSLKGQLQNEVVMNKHLEKYLRDHELYTSEVINEIIDNGISDIEAIPDHIKRVFVTAQQMSPTAHVHMQAAAQKFVDNSISKTCNFPSYATTTDVATIYSFANTLKCKGITVYRDGCRSGQVFVSSSKKPVKSLSVDSCIGGTCDL